MDADDLTVIAYLLRTNPAALLTPPEDETTLTGVLEKFLPEEVEKWARGELVLTNEGLLLYWQQEWVQSLSRIQYFESLLRHGSPSQASHDESAQRLADLKERQRFIRERGVQIDPTGRGACSTPPTTCHERSEASLPLPAAGLDPGVRDPRGQAVAVPDLRPERP